MKLSKSDMVLRGTGGVKSDRGFKRYDAGIVRLYTWDAVQLCSAACPMRGVCEVRDSCVVDRDRCLFMVEYMRSVVQVLFKSCEDRGEESLFRVGMHLMPLYKVLCRLKMEELGTESLMYATDRGDVKITPLVASMLSVVKQIEAMWRSLKIDPIDGIGVPEFAGIDMERGDGDYYDKLEDEFKS